MDRKEAYNHHMSLLLNANTPSAETHREKTREKTVTACLFSGDVLEASAGDPSVLPQYGLLAGCLETLSSLSVDSEGPKQHYPESQKQDDDPRLFINVNTPWSAFLCGSQGSGKSHTLSCMLENSLLPSAMVPGKLPSPLTGLVFHYDKYSSFLSTQICEAAYLCSSSVPVRVLVSPSNLSKMQEAYSELPGLPEDAKKPKVFPLLLKEHHLDVTSMKTLMAISDSNGPPPLYFSVVLRVLREMAAKSENAAGFNYKAFRENLMKHPFTDKQNVPLTARLDLLESFMDLKKLHSKTDIWNFETSSLTIIDLSCPFVDDGTACALFNICLGIFLKDREQSGRIIALDEAHKYMSNNSAASEFTENLLQVIRQQRHLGTRIVIATQEPTISPQLLDLSTMTIVHRFSSPQWFSTLKSHLAGIDEGESSESGETKRDTKAIFKVIVNLEPGEALLFSPSAILSLKDGVSRKLGMQYMKIRVRKRLTTDGGTSILAA